MSSDDADAKYEADMAQWRKDMEVYNARVAQDQGETEGSMFNISNWSPTAFIYRQVKCIVIGLVIFAILIWVISLVPIIGPIVRNGILRVITWLAELAGVAKCGYANEFADVLRSEAT